MRKGREEKEHSMYLREKVNIIRKKERQKERQKERKKLIMLYIRCLSSASVDEKQEERKKKKMNRKVERWLIFSIIPLFKEVFFPCMVHSHIFWALVAGLKDREKEEVDRVREKWISKT